MAKRRYINLKDWIICLSHGKLVEIDNRWFSNFDPDTGESDEYYCNEANKKVMCRSSRQAGNRFDGIYFEHETGYVGKFVATGDDLEELRKRAECGNRR